MGLTPALTISGAKQLFLQKNDNNLPRIINRVLEQREEITPPLTISGAKRLFLRKNDDNLPRIINKVLEQREEITPPALTISGAKQLFLQKNDDNLPKIINEVLEQRDELTPALTISGAKQLFLQKNDKNLPRIITKVLEQREDNLPRIINKVLEEREETTPAFTISRAKQLFVQKNDKNLQRILNKEENSGILSPSESVFLSKVNVIGKTRLSLLTDQTPQRFQPSPPLQTQPSPIKVPQISTQLQSVDNQHQVLSKKTLNLLNTNNFKAFDAKFGGSFPTNPGAAQLTSSIFAQPQADLLQRRDVSKVKVQPARFLRYPASVIPLQRGAINLRTR